MPTRPYRLCDHLPDDIVHQVYVQYRLGVRRRCAQRKLAHTRRRAVHDELARLFRFTNGLIEVMLLGPDLGVWHF